MPAPAQPPAEWIFYGQPSPGYRHPQDTMFASCYRCGARWRPEGSFGLATARRHQRAFGAFHATCPEPVPTRVFYGRCRTANPEARDRLCNGIATGPEGLCPVHGGIEEGVLT